MNKTEFISQLKKHLGGLSEEDIEKSVEYYSEIIDDRIEEGVEESEAVAATGSIEEIARQILRDMPSPQTAKADDCEKATNDRSFKIWEIILITLGFPLWFPLTIAALAIIFSLYITLWAVIFTLYCTDFAIMAGTLFSILRGGIFLFEAKLPHAVFFFGTGAALFGISVLLLFAFNKLTCGAIFISKKIFMRIKSFFAGSRKNRNIFSGNEKGGK